MNEHQKCGAREQSCSCPQGKFYRNGNCVDEGECGCYTESGDVIESGEIITAECNECECVGGSFVCRPIPGCINEGDWSDWSNWSICSSTCLGAMSHPLKTRHRECQPKSIFYQKWLDSNPICQGQPLETKDCDLQGSGVRNSIVQNQGHRAFVHNFTRYCTISHDFWTIFARDF